MKFRFHISLPRHLAIAAIACVSPSFAQTTFNYDESTAGDLSDAYLMPTPLTVGLGNNILSGALSGGTNDLDLIELIVPEGLEVTGIRILDFGGGLNGSFLLVQPGRTLSSAPSNSFGDDIGFSILSATGIDSDVLPTLILPGVSTVAPFFGVDTLGAGSYAFWLNETGPASTYSLQFETAAIVPEPSTSILAGFAALGLLSRRRR